MVHMSNAIDTAAVLLVEDSEVARQSTRRFLEHCGVQVEEAADPQAALIAADQCPPDILICDCNLLKPLDGIDLARQVQQRHGCAVIFVSATPWSSVHRALGGVKVDGWMQKPVSLKELQQQVCNSYNRP